MLVFVGLGLHNSKDISLKGLREVNKADRVFAEFYTSRLNVDLDKLEADLGRDLKVLNRRQVEEKDLVVNEAENKRVVFLVAGEPMSATTHVEMRLSAEERDISTRLIHSSSIFTAAPSLLGLQIYKFGKATTLPFPKDKKPIFPKSPFKTINENLSRGLHTLVLLDIDYEKNRFLNASKALKAMSKVGEGIDKSQLVCVIARAGSLDPKIEAGWLENVSSKDFGEPLHTIVIPGKLHFKEGETLVKLAGAPPEIMD